MDNENEYTGGFLDCSLGMALALIIGGFFLCYSTIWFAMTISKNRGNYEPNSSLIGYLTYFIHLYTKY